MYPKIMRDYAQSLTHTSRQSICQQNHRQIQLPCLDSFAVCDPNNRVDHVRYRPNSKEVHCLWNVWRRIVAVFAFSGQTRVHKHSVQQHNTGRNTYRPWAVDCDFGEHFGCWLVYLKNGRRRQLHKSISTAAPMTNQFMFCVSAYVERQNVQLNAVINTHIAANNLPAVYKTRRLDSCMSGV